MSIITFNSPRPVLADRISRTAVANVLLVIAAAVFVGLLAQISIPLGFTPVPLTGQTFGIMLAGVPPLVSTNANRTFFSASSRIDASCAERLPSVLAWIISSWSIRILPASRFGCIGLPSGEGMRPST